MNPTSFAELNLIEPIERALKKSGYSEPTPIQAQVIPQLLEGRDVLACAQTGTGKTAAFALPLIQRLGESGRWAKKKHARALVVTPTRELAVQVADSFKKYGRFLELKSTVVYGGVKYQNQIRAMSRGVDVLIATPGRLIDLINQGHVKLGALEALVLDEADRMFDMGFSKDVQKIVELIPEQRQTLLFSATMPKEVAKLAEGILTDPVKVQVSPVTSTAEAIDDKVLFVERDNKNALLFNLLREEDAKRVIVFTRTKHRADKLARSLNKKKIRAEAIHGNKKQNARQRALRAFSSGRSSVLVATDVAARGIDVSNISHVINYELPNEAESYIHRIGRTARGGKTGIALSLCDREETMYLAAIERLLKRKVDVMNEHEHHAANIEERHEQEKAKRSKPPRKRGFGGKGRGRPSRFSRTGNGGRPAGRPPKRRRRPRSGSGEARA